MVTYTPQLLFDTVAQALILQGSAAVEPGTDQCVYRTQSGKKCAIGHLIPESLYDPIMEGFRASALIESFGLRELFPPDLDLLMMRLQLVHDTTLKRQGLAAWKSDMRTLALHFDLDPQQVM